MIGKPMFRLAHAVKQMVLNVPAPSQRQGIDLGEAELLCSEWFQILYEVQSSTEAKRISLELEDFILDCLPLLSRRSQAKMLAGVDHFRWRMNKFTTETDDGGQFVRSFRQLSLDLLCDMQASFSLELVSLGA